VNPAPSRWAWSDLGLPVVVVSVAIVLVGLLFDVLLSQQEAKRARCRDRGGVYHCHDSMYRSCDCYAPDGRLVLP